MNVMLSVLTTQPGPDEPLMLKQALTLTFRKDFEKTMRVKCPPKEAIEFDRWVQSQLSSMDFGTRKFISGSQQCLRMSRYAKVSCE